MKKYRVTYNKPDTINCHYDVEAENGREAVTIFQIENPNVEVIKVEELPDD